MSWQRCKRWLGWSFFLAGLIGLGLSVFHFQPAEPLWETSSNADGLNFSPDGRSLFVARSIRNEEPFHESDADRFVLEVRDAATGQITARYPKIGELSGRHAFSSDNRLFAAECKRKNPDANKAERFICLVDLTSGAEHEIALSPGKCFCLPSISPCNKYLASADKIPEFEGKPGSLTIHDVATGKILDRRPSLSVGPWFPIGFTITGNNLLHPIPGKVDSLEQWNLREQQVVATIESGSIHSVVSKDGKFLLTWKSIEGKRENTWLVWNLADRRLQASFPSKHPSESIVIAPNSQWVAITSADRVDLRELATGKRIFSAPGESAGLAFSPDSQILMSHARDRVIGLRVPTLQKIWEVPSPFGEAPVFTEDSRRLAFVHDHSCQICDSSNGKILRRIELLPTVIDSSQLSIQNQSLLIECNNGRIIDRPQADTWWRRTLKKFRIIAEDAEPIRNDVTVVYDLAADREKMRLVRQDVHTAALSPDGAILVTRGPARVLRGWDVARPKPLRYALAAPVGAGVLLLSLGTLWCRWRARKPAPA